VKTTLVEGVIRIRSQQGSKILSAGQQARLAEDGEISLLKAVNVEETVAWRAGYFHFEGAELSAVLREAARWYNVDIVYEGTPRNDKFSGKIERTVPLSTFIKWLRWSDVNIRSNGDRIIVKD
jgi:ferric-dicitrate binding protein FerR (iron transport regulator)